MPPKKDDKKGGGKAAPKEVNPLLYKRSPLVFDELIAEDQGTNEKEETSAAAAATSSSASLTGKIINIDTLFPEWDVENEDWSVGVEDDKTDQIVFPSHIQPTEFKSLKAMLVKEIEDPAAAAGGKGGKKDAPKKGAAPVAVEMEEPVKDAEGNLLPRM